MSFVHIASQDGEANPLGESAAFQRFQNGIRDRCDEPPAVSEAREIGSFNFFGEGR